MAMTLESDYMKAKATLRHINSKITPQARERCAAHTLAEQLAQLRAALADQDDIVTALDADKSWSAQHARLTMPLDGAD
jgi:hypothetical protein